jgi:hypothetical protein
MVVETLLFRALILWDAHEGQHHTLDILCRFVFDALLLWYLQSPLPTKVSYIFENIRRVHLMRFSVYSRKTNA